LVERYAASGATSQFAPTDMLHRRIPLDNSFRLTLDEATVCVRTDCSLLKQAWAGAQSDHDEGDDSYAKWEIAIEVWDGVAPENMETMDEPIAFYSVGPSVAMCMECGSWFAYTPPSMSAVGFAITSGDEHSRVRQLASYLKAVLRLLANDRTQTELSAPTEVCR
jgi:hypothetical protein